MCRLMYKERIQMTSFVFTFYRWLLAGSSGMAVQEVGIPTGFEADVEKLAKLNGVRKVEKGNRKVILYFDEVFH